MRISDWGLRACGGKGDSLRHRIRATARTREQYRASPAQSPGTRKIGVGLLLVSAVISVAGCTPPAIPLYDPQAKPAEAPQFFDDRDWATVLRENVKDELVDYDHLRPHPKALERFINLVGFVGPTRTPDLFRSRASRVAYYINVYNACVLRAVLELYPCDTVHGITNPSLETGYRFRVDGRIVTLADVLGMATEESGGDVRIYFALCNAAKGSPPLPGQPFRPDTLERRLREIAAAAMDNPAIVEINHEEETLYAWLGITDREKEFSDYYCHKYGTEPVSLLSVLTAMANDTRRALLQRAVGYQIRIKPFDRSLNQWEPPQ